MQRVSFMRFATVTLSISLSPFFSGPAFSQGASGNLSGTVKDATGAIVPGATVTIFNPLSNYSPHRHD